MPKRLPIAAAKRVAEEHGLSQVVLLGWDGKRAHVVTYGRTKADCAAAAQAQDFWTGRIREFSFQPVAALATKPDCQNQADERSEEPFPPSQDQGGESAK